MLVRAHEPPSATKPVHDVESVTSVATQNVGTCLNIYIVGSRYASDLYREILVEALAWLLRSLRQTDATVRLSRESA